MYGVSNIADAEYKCHAHKHLIMGEQAITLKIPRSGSMSTVAIFWGITLERAREGGKRCWARNKLNTREGMTSREGWPQPSPEC